MASYTDRLTDSEAMGFISKVEEPFKSLPHLPKGISEFFVKVAPWLALIGAILGLISGPVIGILGTFATLMTLSPVLMIAIIVSAVLTIINSILLLMAFTPLKNREMKGWVLLFWSEMLGLISSIVFLLDGSGSVSSLISTLIGTLIGFYILFEMKPFYGAAQSAVAKVKEATK
jgi:hypothetical protein